MSITVGTYNIMKPNPFFNGHNKAWPERQHELLSNIQNANLDVLCVQELDSTQMDWLTTRVKELGYTFFHASCKEGSGVGIFYRTSAFDLISEKRGIFSADNGARQRSFIQVDLQDKTTQEITRFASMHIYGGTREGNTLGRQQIESFRGQIEQNDDGISRIILAGDFNSDITDENSKSLDGPCKFILNKHADSSYRYNSIDEQIVTSNRSRRHLDWIFVGIRNSLMQADVENILPSNQCHNQILNASDHRLHAIRIKGVKVASKTSQRQFVCVENVANSNSYLPQRIQNKEMITRQDIMNELGVSKYEAENKVKTWIRDGILIKEGHGKNTVYRNVKRNAPTDNTAGHSSKAGENEDSIWDIFKSVCVKILCLVADLFETLNDLLQHRGHRRHNHLDFGITPFKSHHKHKHHTYSPDWRNRDDYGDPSPNELYY